jgi:hypothetical protein
MKTNILAESLVEALLEDFNWDGSSDGGSFEYVDRDNPAHKVMAQRTGSGIEVSAWTGRQFEPVETLPLTAQEADILRVAETHYSRGGHRKIDWDARLQRLRQRRSE